MLKNKAEFKNSGEKVRMLLKHFLDHYPAEILKGIKKTSKYKFPLKDEMLTIELNKSGDLFAFGSLEKIMIYEQTKKKFYTLIKNEANCYSILFNDSLEFKIILASSNSEVIAYYSNDYSIAFYLKKHKKCIRCMNYNNDKKILVTGGEDFLLLIWDLVSKTCILEMKGAHENIITSIHFNSLDSCLYSASAKGGKMWKIDFNAKPISYELQTNIKGFENETGLIKFSSDGKKYLFFENNNIFVKDINTDETIYQLNVENDINFIQFDKSGNKITFGGKNEKYVSIVDLKSYPVKISNYFCPINEVSCAKLHNKFLIASTNEPQIVSWEFNYAIQDYDNAKYYFFNVTQHNLI